MCKLESSNISWHIVVPSLCAEVSVHKLRVELKKKKNVMIKSLGMGQLCKTTTIFLYSKTTGLLGSCLSKIPVFRP